MFAEATSESHLRSGGLLGPGFPLLTGYQVYFYHCSHSPQGQGRRRERSLGEGACLARLPLLLPGSPTNLQDTPRCRGIACPATLPCLSLLALGLDSKQCWDNSCCSWPPESSLATRKPAEIRLPSLLPFTGQPHGESQGNTRGLPGALLSQGSLCQPQIRSDWTMPPGAWGSWTPAGGPWDTSLDSGGG